jgi:hypothetical protein
MIAAYIHNETKETVYVQDFLAKIIAEDLKVLEKEKPVIFKRENDTTTYITSKEVFDKEFTKK